MFYDYYKLLEVSKNASREEIKRSYRKLAKAVHPDVNKSSKAAEVFSVLTEAYNTLIDPVKRNQYNRKLLIAYLLLKRKSRLASRRKVKRKKKINLARYYNFRKKRSAGEAFVFKLLFLSGIALGLLMVLTALFIINANAWTGFYTSLIAIPGMVLIHDGIRVLNPSYLLFHFL